MTVIRGLLLCLFVSLSSANATPSAVQRLSKAVKATVVGVIAAATIAVSPVLAGSDGADRLLWPGSYLDSLAVKELWVASASGGGKEGHGQGRVGLSVMLLDYTDHYAGHGFLQGELSFDNYYARFPLVRAHLIRDAIHEGYLAVMVSSTGYDYIDFRADDLDGETAGFTAQHLHVIGIETPVFSSSIGVGSLGFAKVGNFSQTDLNAWIGEGADLSYVLFHDGSLGFKWVPFRSSSDWGGSALDFHVRQARTIGGDIDFADGADGDFTAIWEELSIQATQRLWQPADGDGGINILAELRLYRERIAADDERGNEFSSSKDGKKASVKFQLLFE